jgi:prophage DNA circulation protein
MAQEPEVIQEQMDETRSALADKLGALTEKITGTVDTVQETVQNAVSNVGQTVETVEQAIEAVASSVESTVESVGETAQAAVENVKETFNIPKQFENHPWLFFGGSVLLGFVGGKIVLNMMPEKDHDHGRSSDAANHMASLMKQAAEPASQPVDNSSRTSRGWDSSISSNGHETSTTQNQEGNSWFGGLLEKFLPDLNKVKELALGTLFATARDLVAQNLPQSLKSDVQNLFNDVAEHAGGKPIQGSILEEGSQQNSGNNSGTQRHHSGQKEVAI